MRALRARPRIAAIVLAALVSMAAGDRQVRVSIEFRQTGTDDSTEIQGSGRIVVHDGRIGGSGTRLGTESRTTKVTRTSGIFTIVQDGGDSTLRVATRVPYEDVQFYRDYARGGGYAVRGVAFENVGTSLKVHAEVLSGRQIRLRLVPSVSYFSADGSGAIDFTDAATELVVEDGKPVTIGGGTTETEALTRRILGYGSSRSRSESSILLRATLE